MSKIRRIFAQVIGGIQCALGVLASVFAYILYASPSTRDLLGISSREIYLYMFLLLIFGAFLILSGLLGMQRR